MSNQTLKQNLVITIEDGYVATIYSSNSNSDKLNKICMYMNDKIQCKVSIYNHYIDTSIGGQDTITPLTGVSAVAMIKVEDRLLKNETLVSDDNSMNFIFQIPYIDTTREELEGKLQILITDASGDKIHTPIIEIGVRKPLGDINTLEDSSDRIAELLKEKTLKRFEIEANALQRNGEGQFEVVLEHNIISLDGNLFVSVLGEEKMDISYKKYKIDNNHLRIAVADRQKLYITIRK